MTTSSSKRKNNLILVADIMQKVAELAKKHEACDVRIDSTNKLTVFAREMDYDKEEIAYVNLSLENPECFYKLPLIEDKWTNTTSVDFKNLFSINSKFKPYDISSDLFKQIKYVDTFINDLDVYFTKAEDFIAVVRNYRKQCETELKIKFMGEE